MSDNYYKALGEIVKLTHENTELREELVKSQALSVSNILMAVTPGESGTGYEHYAKSVREVEGVLGDFADQVEELQEKLSASNLNYALLYKRLTAAEKDARRYRKLQLWMASNVKEGWQEVEKLGGISAWMSCNDMDQALDDLSECSVGLCAKPTESGAGE